MFLDWVIPSLDLNLLNKFLFYQFNQNLIMYLIRKIIATLVILFIVNVTVAQTNAFYPKKINTSKFPKITGELWVRNPNGISSDFVEFYEDNSAVAIKPQFTSKKAATDSMAKNKALVFLVLNTYNSTELRWYKEVIKNAISRNNIKKGDKVTVIDFNNELAGQLLFPDNPTFTDDINAINQKLDNIQPRIDYCICSVGKSLVTQAINQTLSLLEKKNFRMPTGVIVLADDNVCNSNAGTEPPEIRSKRLNIPVYAINYNNPLETVNSIEDLCKNTYGDYFSDFLRSQSASSSKLQTHINKFLEQYSGLYYSFEYQSACEKDGKTHALRVVYSGEQSAAPFSAPSKNPIEWIAANPILAGIIFLVLSLIGVLIFLLISKNNKKKALEKMLEQQRIAEIDKKHKQNQDALSDKMRLQQSELEELKRKEQVKKDEEVRKKAAAEKEKKDEALVAQMKLKGNLPWFDYTTGSGGKQHYQIRKSEVTVGRSEGCDLRVDLPTISKKHFVLTYTANNEYWVRDLGSSNGLYVNGKHIQQAKLHHGDFIQAGELVLNFFI